MLRLLFILFMVFQFGYGFLVSQTDYASQERMLRSLDINPAFMKDPAFISMKGNVSKYRTKHFLEVLKKGQMFVPLLREMIKEAEIPDTFLYLAMVESNFSPRAYSKAKAVGLWQFMTSTANTYKLKIDDYIDERRDPILSTKAAIKYLKRLHDRFGKWYLAAMAYNVGEGRLAKAIEKAKSNELSVLLDSEAKYLPKETRDYMKKIIIMAQMSSDTDMILGNDAEHLMNQGSGSAILQVEVPGGTPLIDVADSIGISYKTLKSFNNHIKKAYVPPLKTSYHIYIPQSKQSAFVKNFKPSENRSFYEYTVEKGDSLYKIGKKYKIKYSLIKDYNRLSSNNLKLNQKLIIPVLKPKVWKYKIIKGDTLGHIANKFNVKTSVIMQMNGLKSSMIKPGAILVIPKK